MTSRAIWLSCGESRSQALGSGAGLLSPAARSSRRTRSTQGRAPVRTNSSRGRPQLRPGLADPLVAAQPAPVGEQQPPVLERPVAPVAVERRGEDLLRLVGVGQHGLGVADRDVDADGRRAGGQRREPGELGARLVRVARLDGRLRQEAQAAARLHPLVRRVLRRVQVPQVLERLVRAPEARGRHAAGEVGDRQPDRVPPCARQLGGPRAQLVGPLLAPQSADHGEGGETGGLGDRLAHLARDPHALLRGGCRHLPAGAPQRGPGEQAQRLGELGQPAPVAQPLRSRRAVRLRLGVGADAGGREAVHQEVDGVVVAAGSAAAQCRDHPAAAVERRGVRLDDEQTRVVVAEAEPVGRLDHAALDIRRRSPGASSVRPPAGGSAGRGRRRAAAGSPPRGRPARPPGPARRRGTRRSPRPPPRGGAGRAGRRAADAPGRGARRRGPCDRPRSPAPRPAGDVVRGSPATR